MTTVERLPSAHSDKAHHQLQDDNISTIMHALSAQLLQPLPSAFPSRAASARDSALRQPESVRGTVAYTKPTPSGEELFTYVYAMPDGQQNNNLVTDEQTVQINDLHTAKQQFSLQRNGFQLESLPVADDIDWDKDEEVRLGPTQAALYFSHLALQQLYYQAAVCG